MRGRRQSPHNHGVPGAKPPKTVSFSFDVVSGDGNSARGGLPRAVIGGDCKPNRQLSLLASNCCFISLFFLDLPALPPPPRLLPPITFTTTSSTADIAPSNDDIP